MDVAGRILKFLNVIRPDKLPAEIRILRGDDPVLNGVYDFDHRALIPEHIAEYDDNVKGIYFGLNAPDWPVSNCLQTGKTVGNDNIPHRNLLFFDFDPVRFGPDGVRLKDQEVPSTEPEKLRAMERAKQCRQYLMDLGAPEPILADSGNGAHLLWMLDIDREMLSSGVRKDAISLDGLYAHLQQKFNDDRVTFDVKVKNAGRICKLYGSRPHKGSNTEERPWRRFRLIEGPDDWAEKPFPNNLVLKLTPENREAAVVEVDPRDVTDAEFKDSMLWLKQFLKSSKAKVTSNFIRDAKGFRICVQCPLFVEHKKYSGSSQTTILMERGKGYSFHCHHAHAEAVGCGETLDWAWFRKQVESEDLGPIEVEEADNTPEIDEELNTPAGNEIPEDSKLIWRVAANDLDRIREGVEAVTEKGRKIYYPAHITDDNILRFVVKTLKTDLRSRFFVDGYPYIFIPNENVIYKFHNDDEAHRLLSRLHLRITQQHCNLTRKNLALHILTFGEQTRIEKWGCMRGVAVYVNNGRGGIIKINTDCITEVQNGTDNVFMIAQELQPWPALDLEKMAKMAERLGGELVPPLVET